MSGPTVITIGNFDGVHLGHQAILQAARQRAMQLQTTVTILTFDPPPAAVLRPGSEPSQIMTVDERRRALCDAGADEVVILRPTPELLGLAPRAFLEQLVKQYRIAAVVEGANFRFGKGRAGDVNLLRSAGADLSFDTVVVPQVELALCDLLMVTVSSSLVRWLLAQGRAADAALALGRPFALTGRVIEGEKRGRALGFATINLDPQAIAGRAVPADGVFAGAVEIDDGAVWPAAISIGVKPTFGQRARTIEAHMLDFAGDLYGHRVTIRFARWLRDQQAFPSLAALCAQLERDVRQTRQWHNLGLLDGSVRHRPMAVKP